LVTFLILIDSFSVNIVNVSIISFIISFKYSKLTYLDRTALALSHGNAVPERGFSWNNSLIITGILFRLQKYMPILVKNTYAECVLELDKKKEDKLLNEEAIRKRLQEINE